MNNVNIKTRLSLYPISCCCGCSETTQSINKGATAIFALTLSDKMYKYADITQVVFLFRQAAGDIKYFNFFDENHQPVKTTLYSAEYDTILDELEIKLSPEITKTFSVSEKDDEESYLSVEVAVTISDNVIIEQQPSVCVLDSIYATLS